MPYQLRDGTTFHLLRCAGRLKQRLEQALREYDITPVQFGVLGLLWETDNLPQHEIASRLGKDRPNVSRVLEKMSQKHLITRTPAPGDRRSLCISLTPQGHALRPRLEPFAQAFRSQINQGLSDADQRQLIALLTKMTDNLA